MTREQGLGGTQDAVLIEVCHAEERCLVTLDLDFAHILNYPPERYTGIAVLRSTGLTETTEQPSLTATPP